MASSMALRSWAVSAPRLYGKRPKATSSSTVRRRLKPGDWRSVATRLA